jgi:glycosyltransferase involved in cell wall biosynthesis
MPLFCRRASRIVAISECTKRDLVSAYGVPREKISVVYEAADPTFKPQPAGAVASACARYGLPDRYLLFVGTIEPRKNLGRLLQAFEALKADGLTDGLVIVGRFGWLYQRFLAQLEASPARDAVLFPGYVPDDDLPAVYTGAQAVVFPSLYEGFGLPVLEAMACGTPVVASRAASIPEIGAEAASYFDPTSVGSITDAVSHVLKDPNLQAEMRQAGFARAAQFSWDRVATETRQVYSALLEDGSILGGHGAP